MVRLLKSALLLTTVITGLLVGHYVLNRRLEAIATKSQPLIDALNRFTKAHGAPPNDLEELVPEYLEYIPSTGIGAFPNYRYSIDAPGGNPWVLTVIPPPKGVIQFDEFIYYPGENYPESGSAGVYSRVANWGYLHE